MPSLALGCAQMETLDQFIALKPDIAFRYREFIRESEFIFFDEPEGRLYAQGIHANFGKRSIRLLSPGQRKH